MDQSPNPDEMERLWRENLLFREVAERVGVIFYLAEPDYSHFHYVSPAYESIWMRPVDELYRDPGSWRTAVHPDDLPRVEAIIAANMGKGRYQADYRVGRSDGSMRWVRAMATETFDAEGRPTKVAGVVSDITEQKQQELNMHRLLAEQRAILTNTPVGIAITGLDRRIREANQAFATIFGLRSDTLAGQSTRLTYHSDEDYEALGRRAYPVLQGGGTFRDDVSMRRVDGTNVWLRLVGHLIDTAEPELGVVWVFEDISEIKSMEMDLKRSNAELEQFAYVASHDLRQPLRMVSGYLGLIERRLKDRLDGDDRDFIAFATDGAKRMDRMIMDLLEYSRIGHDSLDTVPVDLDEGLTQALANLKPAVAEAGAEVHVQPGLPTVRGQESELVRLFQNLIGNAVKFRAPGRQPRVSVECVEMAHEWVFAVSDNGIGIAPDDHGRLFAIFQRLVPSDQYEGTGIGLAACRKICSRLGGRIWVESQLGRGSIFLVALPK